MSDDFDFEDFGDDLFGDDSDEEEAAVEEDLEENDMGGFFDDEDDEYDLDDVDEGEDFDDEFGGDLFEGEEELGDIGGGGGLSRPFMLMMGGMMLISILGIVLVAALVLIKDPVPSDLDVTRTAVAVANATDMAAFDATQTAQLTVNAQSTMDAEGTAAMAQRTADAEGTVAMLQRTADVFASATESARMTEMAESMITPTETPTPFGVSESDLLRTQQANEMTQTAIAGATEIPLETRSAFDPTSVALTGTAIAEALRTQRAVTPFGTGGPDEATPTGEGGVLPTALPTTGLFSGMSSGGSGLALFILAAFGLFGVIVGARTLRTLNRRS